MSASFKFRLGWTMVLLSKCFPGRQVLNVRSNEGDGGKCLTANFASWRSVGQSFNEPFTLERHHTSQAQMEISELQT